MSKCPNLRCRKALITQTENNKITFFSYMCPNLRCRKALITQDPLQPKKLVMECPNLRCRKALIT